LLGLPAAMANAPDAVGSSLMNALKTMASSVLDMLQTRLSLLTNELQIQKQQLILQLWMTLALTVCLLLAGLLLVALAVLVWWEQRIFVVFFAALLFSGLSLAFLIALRRAGTPESTPLTHSLAALQEDLRQLKQAADREPPTR